VDGDTGPGAEGGGDRLDMRCESASGSWHVQLDIENVRGWRRGSVFLFPADWYEMKAPSGFGDFVLKRRVGAVEIGDVRPQRGGSRCARGERN